MATVLPPVRNDISGAAPNPSNAVARTAFGVLHDYLINLLGSAGTPAAARTALGSSASGDSVFTGTPAAARTALGSSASGDSVFTGTPAAARTALGSGTVGDALFLTTTNTAAENAMGVTRSLAASGYRKTGDGLIIQWGTTVVITNGAGGFAIMYPIAFPTAAYTSILSVGDNVSMGTIATIEAQLTTTSVGGIAPSAISTNIRVNWIVIGN